MKKISLFLLACSCLVLMSSVVTHAQEYYYLYIEAENYTSGAKPFLNRPMVWTREEGWAEWMIGTSGGLMLCFNPDGGWSEYLLSGLPKGEYRVFVKLISHGWDVGEEFMVKVLWDGKEVGETMFLEWPGEGITAEIRWAPEVGRVKVDGKSHTLRLEPGDNMLRPTYVDAILLTNDPDFVPSHSEWFEKYIVLQL